MKKILYTLGVSLLVAGGAQAALVFQMDFNDAAGNQSLTDRSTTGVSGSFTGGSAYSTDVASVNSGGYSGSFDGSSGAANFGNIAALDGLSQFTMTAWIRSSTSDTGGPSNSGRVVSRRSGNNGVELYYHDTDDELELVPNGSPVANGGGSIAGQQWTWVAVTYDGTQTTNNVTFYTGDGTTLSTGDIVSNANGVLNTITSDLLIGNTTGDNRTFSGLIDNVRIYNTVEDAASLQSIMQFDDTDLIFQMDFNDAEGNQSLTDRGTTGVTGSFAGGATYSETVAPFNTGGFSGAFATGSDAADFGDIDALDGLSAMTMTAWIKSSAVEAGGAVGSGRILAKRSGSGFELYYHNPDNALEFVADGAGNTVFNGGGSIAVDQWVFLAVTWTGGTATFYTGDGTTLSAGQVDTGTAQTLQATTASLLLGNNAAGDRLYQGLIDNVRIYKTVKDAASLQTIMQYNDAANAPEGPTVTLSTAVDLVDSAYTVDVTFSADVSGLKVSDFVVTNGTASGVSPATGAASSYTVTITPTALGTVTVQLPADSATDSGSLPNLASNVLSTTSDDPKRPITVRVAAYNVEFGSSATPEQIGALLLPYNLDIIGFNEVPDGDWTARVGAVLGMDYTFVGQIASANHAGPEFQDITGNYDGKYKSILSRTPLEGTNEFTLTGSGWNPASAVRATTRIDGNSVAFYSLHISNKGTTDSQAYQLATQVLPQETADRVIVVGDFNNRIGDFNINAIENAEYEATWADLNIDVTQEKTYNAQDPNTSHGVIDHIFFNTSSGARVTDGEIIEEVSPLSDHKPIWAEIAFPDDISILNSSFDADDQGGDGGFVVGAPTGWSSLGGTVGTINFDAGVRYTTADADDANPSGGTIGAMDDNQALFTISNGGVSQTLTENIVVGQTYTLTVAIGDHDAGTRADFSGYDIRLLAGGSPVATLQSTESPGDGTFTDVELVYTAQAGDSGLLGIELREINGGTGKTVDFDNVRLMIWEEPPVVDPAIAIASLQDRQIVQRDWSDHASFPVSGTFTGSGGEIQARAVAIDGNGTDTDWVTIDAAPSEGSYAGTLDVDAGWYQLEIRLLDGAEVIATALLARVGVGDIFITCGQSNSANYGEETQSAADDRVSYLGLLTGTWVHADDPNTGNPSGGPGSGGSPWPKLGDLLAAQDDVPVGFVSIGDGSASVESWMPASNDNYPNLKTAVQSFGTYGFKAVLWHQGERDALVLGTSTADYRARLETIIAASRADAGWDVPWGVALVSSDGTSINPNQNTVEAQLEVIANDDHVFAGANTDPLIGLPYRTQVHFAGEGLTAHAELWFASLNDAFPDFEITGFSVAGNAALLSFAGTRGNRYQVEMTDDLTSSNSWVTVTDILSLPESPFSVELTITNEPSFESSFYRVKRIR